MLPLIVAGAGLAGAGILGSYLSGAAGASQKPNQGAYNYNYKPTFDWTQANSDYGRAGASQGGLAATAQLERDRAAGKLGPSVAEQQLRAGQAAAAADAAQAAASARGGPGMMALAQRQAQAQQVAGEQAANRDAGIVRSQEEAAALQRAASAEAAAGQLALGMRQGSQGQTFGEQDRAMQAARYQQEGAIAYDRASMAAAEAEKRRKQAMWGSLTNAGTGMATMGLMSGGGPGGNPAPTPAPEPYEGNPYRAFTNGSGGY